MNDIAEINTNNTMLELGASITNSKGIRTSDLATMASNIKNACLIGECLSKSTIIGKQYWGKPADITAAILQGSELGLNVFQSLKQIYVVNGAASLMAEGMLAIVMGSGLLENIEEEELFDASGKLTGYSCTVTRKGTKRVVKRRYTLPMAVASGQWDKEIWKKYPARMLYKKALGMALKDSFPDILGGIASAEDLEEMTPSTPSPQISKSIDAGDKILADFDMDEIIVNDEESHIKDASDAIISDLDEGLLKT